MSKRDHIRGILGLAIGATIDFAKDEITDRINGIEDAMIKDIDDITDRLDAIEARLPAPASAPVPCPPPLAWCKGCGAWISPEDSHSDCPGPFGIRKTATGEQPPPPEPAVVAEPDIIKSVWDRLLRLSGALAEIRDTSPTFGDMENQIYRIKAIASGALGAFGPGAAPIPPLDDTAEVKRLRDALREIRDTPSPPKESYMSLIARLRDIAGKTLDE